MEQAEIDKQTIDYFVSQCMSFEGAGDFLAMKGNELKRYDSEMISGSFQTLKDLAKYSITAGFQYVVSIRYGKSYPSSGGDFSVEPDFHEIFATGLRSKLSGYR